MFRHPDYIRVIVTKSWPAALWFWARHLIFFVTLYSLVATAALVYFVPQMSRILDQNLPPGQFSVVDGRLLLGQSGPILWGERNFGVLVDPQKEESALADYRSGVLINSTRIILRSATGQIQSRDLADWDGLQYDKSQVVDWVRDNKGQLLALGMVAIVLGGGIFVLGFGLWGWVTFLVWAVVWWLIFRFSRRPLSYAQSLSVVLHAAVFPLIISSVSLFSGGLAIGVLELSVFVFYVVSWLRFLPTSVSDQR